MLVAQAAARSCWRLLVCPPCVCGKGAARRVERPTGETLEAMVGLQEVEGHSGLRRKGSGTGAAVELEIARQREPAVSVPALRVLRGNVSSRTGAGTCGREASDRESVLTDHHGLVAVRTAALRRREALAPAWVSPVARTL